MKILHKPWLSERDAVPHAPSFLPQFGDAPHLDAALKSRQKKCYRLGFWKMLYKRT